MERGRIAAGDRPPAPKLEILTDSGNSSNFSKWRQPFV
jgi:hypothetical protein